MRAMLFHLDGALPNIALMRLAAHYRDRGYEIDFRRTGQPERTLFEASEPDIVCGSIIFDRSRPVAQRLLKAYPDAIIGGTGWNVASSLEQHDVTTTEQDYSIYPDFRPSIGFSQRGCRLRCPFCVVPQKEGRIRTEQSIYDIWRGGEHPKELLLLDNDFFGQSDWKVRIAEIREGNFKVAFSQGINARFLSDEAAEAIASIQYRDNKMSTRRIYTAWDNRKDEQRLFDGLKRLVRYGVQPDHIMVYMLCGYWPGETHTDRDYRRQRLRDFGARPYPMPFRRTPELVGFQRWVVAAYDKRVAWHDFAAANYRPENVRPASDFPLFEPLT